MTRTARSAALGLTALSLVVLSAWPASAHVTVSSQDATQGGFAKIAFRIPTESDTASTTKVQVVFPADQPLQYLSVKPHAGWSYDVTRTGDTVSAITWTADRPDTAIAPGEFDEFEVSGGFLPKTDEMVFKAVQTYSDGEVVRWIDPTPASGEEPEHPAPVLTLPAPGEEAEGHSHSDTEDTEDTASVTATTPVAATTDDSGSSTLPTLLSALALVVALGAGALAWTSRARR